MGLCSKPRKSLLALNQMMSKGTIQAELRGQLGRSASGAFELWQRQ
jgi:hypothetical protein